MLYINCYSSYNFLEKYRMEIETSTPFVPKYAVNVPNWLFAKPVRVYVVQYIRVCLQMSKNLKLTQLRRA